jgi:Recombinase
VFTRTNLYRLLTRVAYTGKIQYKHETHPGEHQAIVDPEVWQRVQVLLRRHGRRDPLRCHSGALLQRLLRCADCGCYMVPTYCLRQPQPSSGVAAKGHRVPEQVGAQPNAGDGTVLLTQSPSAPKKARRTFLGLTGGVREGSGKAARWRS